MPFKHFAATYGDGGRVSGTLWALMILFFLLGHPALVPAQCLDEDGDGVCQPADCDDDNFYCRSNCSDLDLDGVCDDLDNCFTDFNPEQRIGSSLLNGILTAGGDVWYGGPGVAPSFLITPDNRWVVYAADQVTDGVTELYRVPIWGGQELLLSQAEASGATTSTFDVTATHVVHKLYYQADNRTEIFTVPLAGGAPQRLHAQLPPGSLVRLVTVWGDRVVYTSGDWGGSNPTGVVELFSVPADGSAPPTTLSGIVPPGFHVQNFIISPDGTRVIYTAEEDSVGIVELFQVPVAGGVPPVKLSQTLPSTGDVTRFGISPDSLHAVYMADVEADQAFGLFSAPIDGSAAPTRISLTLCGGDGCGSVDRFDFYASGGRVLYTADYNVNGRDALYSVAMDGTGTQTLENLAVAPDWTLNGTETRVVYRATPLTGPTELYSRDPAAPVRNRINDLLVDGADGVRDFLISPTDDRVAYAADQDTPGVDELYGAGIDGGGSVKLNETLSAGGGLSFLSTGPDIAFSPDGGTLFYVADHGGIGSTDLFSVSALTGPPAVRLNDGLVAGGNVQGGPTGIFARTLPSFTASDDGTWVVYRADQRVDEVFEAFSVSLVSETDADGDGTIYLCDCDDGNATIGADADSDGACLPLDCDDFNPAVGSDVDGDGSCLPLDCDDADPAVYPGAEQICDGQNNDCDHASYPGIVGTNETDDDGDGLSECSGDCDDAREYCLSNCIDRDRDDICRDLDVDETNPFCGTNESDRDQDRICDDQDNCIDVPNPDQGARKLNPSRTEIIAARQARRRFALTGDGTRVLYEGVHYDPNTIDWQGYADPNLPRLYSVSPQGGHVVAFGNGLFWPDYGEQYIHDFSISQDSQFVVYGATPYSTCTPSGWECSVSLFTEAIETGTPTPLDEAQSRLADPFLFVISPDDAQVIFRTATGLSRGPRHGAAGSVEQLDTGEIWSFAVSPDSNWIVYVKEDVGGATASVYSVPISGGTPMLLGSGIEAAPPPDPPLSDFPEFTFTAVDLSISNDSSQVVFTAKVGGRFRVFSVPIGGGVLTQLSGPGEAEGDCPAYWDGWSSYVACIFDAALITPDDTRVIFQEDGRLYVVPIAGGTQLPLTPSPPAGQGVTDFRLSVDGSMVVYRADQNTDDVFELFSVPVSGGSPEQLSGTLHADGDVAALETMNRLYPSIISSTVTLYQRREGFAISTDSRYVVFRADANIDEVYELYSVPIGGGAILPLNEPLNQTSGGVVTFAIDPGGTRVVYSLSLSAPYGDLPDELRVVPVHGGESVLLNDNTAATTFASHFHFAVSEDGSTVVFETDPAPRSSLSIWPSRLHTRLLDPTGGLDQDGDDRGAACDCDDSDAAVADDTDSDGWCDVFDCDATDPDVYPGALEICDGKNNDCYHPSYPGLAGTPEADDDGDGLSECGGDCNDSRSSCTTDCTDADGDGICLPTDCDDANPGCSADCTDTDADGVCDLQDNCSAVANPGQGPVKLNEDLSFGKGVREMVSTGDGARVVYRADQAQENVYELYSVGATGGPVAKLNGDLTDGGDVRDFVLTSDDRFVVYRADQQVDGSDELYRVPVDGGRWVKLSGDLAPHWTVVSFALTRDDSHVVYLARRLADGIQELYSVALSGGVPQRIDEVFLPGSKVMSFVLAGDQHVVYEADQEVSGQVELFLVDIDGGTSVQINQPLALDGTIGRYAAGPQGATVVYLEITGLGESLYSVSLSSGAVTHLRTCEWVLDFEYSPDGTRLVYLCHEESIRFFELGSITVDGLSFATLSNYPGTWDDFVINSFEIAPDGQFVIYQANHDFIEKEIFRVPTIGGAAVKLVAGPTSGGRIGSMTISPDSSYVVFRSQEQVGGEYALYSTPLAGGAAIRLSPDPATGIRIGSSDISPDDLWVAYHASMPLPAPGEIHLVPMVGGSPLPVNAGSLGGSVLTSLRFTADGQRLLYVSDEDLAQVGELYSAPVTSSESGLDRDNDGRGGACDCDDTEFDCGTDCNADVDGDGFICVVDCDDTKPGCTTECTDQDDDGFCVTTDCDETNANCNTDCTDGDADGFCLPADCDDNNRFCNADCTDADTDGVCLPDDCNDRQPGCTLDCTDADGDGVCRGTLNRCPITYGGSEMEAMIEGIPTADGGLIVAGTTDSFGAGLEDVWVVRLDAAGSFLWQKTYGGPGEDRAAGIVAAPDGGWVVAATRDSGPAGTSVWVFRIDNSGVILWQESYGLEGENCHARKIRSTSDGGFIVAADTDAGSAWVLKLDATGSVQWHRLYGSGAELTDVAQDGDGYILSGRLRSFTPSNTSSAWLLKLDGSGQVQWTRSFHTGVFAYPVYIQTTGDGYLMATAADDGADGNSAALVVVRTDATGEIVWQKTYDGPAAEMVNALLVTPDDEYLVSAVSYSFGAGSTDAWLLRLNDQGLVLSQSALGGDAGDAAHSIGLYGDGTVVLSGATGSFGAGGSDGWVLTIPADGTLSCAARPVAAIVASAAYVPQFPVIGSWVPLPSFSTTAVVGVDSVATPPAVLPCCDNADCDDASLTCSAYCGDGDGDGLACSDDCNDSEAHCTTDCSIDADGDGASCLTDCDDQSVGCNIDCADLDRDGVRACDGDCDDTVPGCSAACGVDADLDGLICELDCDDLSASCTDDCRDRDGDGVPACAGDCDDTNPHCTSDCTDLDSDGYCVTSDCNDGSAIVHPGAFQLCDGLNNDCADGNWPAPPDNEFDNDGDGYVECGEWTGSGTLTGESEIVTQSILGGGDCDDADENTYPDAPETNDAQDNQCPGESGYGQIDEVSGIAGFPLLGNTAHFAWPAQSNATSYEVGRAGRGDFVSGCTTMVTGATAWDDTEEPSVGEVFFYLVRPNSPNRGSWGHGSGGMERTVCSAP